MCNNVDETTIECILGFVVKGLADKGINVDRHELREMVKILVQESSFEGIDAGCV